MDEEMASQFRRPRFHVGMRVRVIGKGRFSGECGTIRSVSALENAADIFETYSYRVVLDDLLIADLPEDAIEEA